MNNDPSYEDARKKVKALRGFYVNLFIYIIINIGLAILNLITSPGHLWFLYVLFGWGIGIIIQAISVFGKNSLLGSAWEDRKIKEFMDKNKPQ